MGKILAGGDKMENENLQTSETFKTIGYSLFTMLIAIIVVQILMSAVLLQAGPEIRLNPWINVLLIGIPFYLFGFPLFLWITRKIPDGPKGEVKSLSFKEMLTIFFIAMAGTYVFNIVGNFINQLIGSLMGKDIANPLESALGGSSLIPTLIFVVILSPIIEEIVFRGVILDKLRAYSDKTAIIFTSLTFALFHGNLSQFFYAFILGLIFAYITVKTNTIRYAVILHILVNLFGTVIMPMLALSGNNSLVVLSSILVIAFMLIGGFLFIKNYKKIRLDLDSEDQVRVRKKTAYGNIGMILFYIVCLGLFTSVIAA